MDTMFFGLPTETTGTTTTNSISYKKKKFNRSKKVLFFLTVLLFGNSYEILISMDFYLK